MEQALKGFPVWTALHGQVDIISSYHNLVSKMCLSFLPQLIKKNLFAFLSVFPSPVISHDDVHFF